MAMVAIQLGLVEDAVSLYKEAGRTDLLNQLYQVRKRRRRIVGWL